MDEFYQCRDVQAFGDDWRRKQYSRRARAPQCVAVWVTIAAIFAFVAGCGAQQTGASAGSTDTLTFGITQGFTNLDPAKDGAGPQTTARSLSYASLIHATPSGSLAPALASSWGYLGDGNDEFQITLRRDAKFSDGSPVDANAVKGWLEYFIVSKGPNSSYVHIDSIDVPDQWTVRIHLAQPCPIMPQFLSDQWTLGSVVGPKGLAQPAGLATETDGAGPYVLVSSQSVPGDHYTYEPNPYYYHKTSIKLKKVVARVIADPNSMLQAMKAGTLQVALGDTATAGAASKADLALVKNFSGTTGLVLADRVGKLSPALGDVRVRQALNYAIDRRAVTAALAGDYGVASSTWATTDGWSDELASAYPYDPKKAKDLLTQAGYQDGLTLKVVSQGNWGNYGDPVARVAAQYFKAVGVNLDITVGSPNSVWAKGVTSGSYPVYQLYGNLLPMWFFYQVFVAAASPFNPFKAGDDPSDAIWRQGSASGNSNVAWQELSKRITEQAFFVPVFRTFAVWYTARNVRGVGFNGDTLYPLATEWTIE